ncbi:enoyl-CoA hydratase-related protein [Gordonia sp. NB41Y]|uniref:enoyl-CoA hydratase/isomerase family protein n=1 Tax=Gordonia sp. NB41Y TaxID=875808 RepID=UPI0006B1A9F0|nr:enoyl-CoA hydratase-related protein [Gordonia sp. NB41Y]EMP14063.2 enoyl-CoA hydratase [Gordonia sp. NB41Y]WLP89276.1 enoyl-CoA hydratase-related protein [Gordonia sp. NB41Y]
MTVTLEVDGALATITIDRPAAHNALDLDTKTAFLRAVHAVSGDGTIRAVLLRAEGKNFCVGQDLGEHVAALEVDANTAMDTVAQHYNPLIEALDSLRVPVVAAIQGACVGAGWGIALTADIRVAGTRTSFATAFTGIALASDSGLSRGLVAALGPSRASGLMLLGEKVSAAQAAEWGLVHRLVDDADVHDVAREIAATLAAGPTAAYVEVKALMRAADGTLAETLDREAKAQSRLGATADHKAAVTAFLSKTRPQFIGS